MKAQNSTDMLCAWRGKDLQGTSLPKVHPKDLKTGFRQCGLGFAMSYRLAKLLKKCWKQKLKLLTRETELTRDRAEQEKQSYLRHDCEGLSPPAKAWGAAKA
jgi:hypothetical protein